MTFDLAETFRGELLALVDSLESSLLGLDERPDRAQLDEVFRAAHNIKSAAAMMGLTAAAERAHHLETDLDEIRCGRRAADRAAVTRLLEEVDRLRGLVQEPPHSPSPHVDELPAHPIEPSPRALETITANVRRVEALVDLAAELAIAATQLEQLRSAGARPNDGRMVSACRGIRRVSVRIQEAAMAMRLVPVASVFSRLRRHVRDQALRLGKDVSIDVVGAQTELDKSVAERLFDPLQHLVRNALDHGLELPAARVAAGKAPVGRLVLSARQAQSEVIVAVEDDGRGLDLERIRAVALQRGSTEAAAASDAEVVQLLFQPGFTTSEQVGELSGRGVGLDVVRRHVIELGGEIRLEGEPGRGCRVSLAIPRSLAVIEGLVVRCGSEHLVVPVDDVRQLVRPTPEQVGRLPDGREVLCLPVGPVPLLRADEVLGFGPVDRRKGVAVLMNAPSGPVALHVDDVTSQERIMLKSLQRSLRGADGMLGATVLGDGRVALVLDVGSLCSRAA